MNLTRYNGSRVAGIMRPGAVLIEIRLLVYKSIPFVYLHHFQTGPVPLLLEVGSSINWKGRDGSETPVTKGLTSEGLHPLIYFAIKSDRVLSPWIFLIDVPRCSLTKGKPPRRSNRIMHNTTALVLVPSPAH